MFSTLPLGSPQIYGSVKANRGVSFCKGHLLVWGLVVPGSETHFRYAPPSSPGDHTVLLRTLQILPPSCSSCLCIHPFCSQAKQALLSLRPSTQCCTVSTFLNRHLPACQLASVACCSAAHPERQGSHHICGSLESQSCSFIQNQANGYPVTFLVTGASQMW